jgi:hypothetical protein
MPASLAFPAQAISGFHDSNFLTKDYPLPG